MVDWLPIHFLRPEWLLGVPAAALPALWNLQLQRAAWRWRGRIAPHLLPHLVVRPPRSRTLGPTAWLFAILALASVSLAGPSWEREPSPFATDKAALVVILDLAPSMLQPDPAPNRLHRARLKLRELLALRHDGLTGLIALGASAHRVLPFTDDRAAARTYIDILEPRLMPPARSDTPADRIAAALSLAAAMLERHGGQGSVLLVTDTLPAAADAPVQPVVWTFGSTKPPHPDWAVARIHWRADDADVVAVNRAIVRQLEAAEDHHPDRRWRDGGIWLLGPLVALALFGARRGWNLRW
jgi:Ca-activated chloride channel family protein